MFDAVQFVHHHPGVGSVGWVLVGRRDDDLVQAFPHSGTSPFPPAEGIFHGARIFTQCFCDYEISGDQFIGPFDFSISQEDAEEGEASRVNVHFFVVLVLPLLSILTWQELGRLEGKVGLTFGRTQ